MAKDEKVSRRKFLKITAGALGAGAVMCGGSAWFGLRTPASVLFPRSSCPYSAGDRVLVAYASKCGATAEIADRIAQDLCSAGLQADLRAADEVRDLADYRAVILGTAIYMGRPLAAAGKFVERLLAPRPDLPLAFFSVSLTMKENTPENVETALDNLETLTGQVTPRAVGLFPGRIDFATLPPLYRMFAQADSEGALAEGDYRDWDEIARWAREAQGQIL
jgi:menaquinone-dependent protoporphyrinogen oxidase